MNCMKMAGVTTSAILMSACAQPGADIEAERAMLREADADYSDAAITRDIDRWLSYYAAGAILYPPNGGSITGMEGIREFGTEITGLPDFSASFDPVAVEVSVDGDMGYTLNNLMVTFTGADGDPVTDQGPDLHVWRKQVDGSWKIVRDIWNSSLSLEEPEDTSQADREAISSLREREMDAFSNGNTAALAAVFTDDVVILPPNEPGFRGTQAQQDWFNALLAEVTVQGTYTETELNLAGDLAYEQLAFTMAVTPTEGGETVEETGKGLHIYERQPDGSWRIALDIWNFDSSNADAE